MNKIYLLRSTDGDPDSRFQKYIWYLQKKSIPFKAICWDRQVKKIDSDKIVYYHNKAEYGKGLSNILGILKFNIFILINLLKDRKNVAIIHAADFDTIIPAIIMKFLFRKKVIYDIYDWYIDSRSITGKFLSRIIKFFESINIKNSDIVIICEPERRKQIIYEPKHLWILPNIPNFKTLRKNEISSNNISVAYVGVLGKERGLENLIKLAKEFPNIEIKVAGFGPLAKLFIENRRLENIHYYGTVSYPKALDIMSQATLIYACYERSNPNHILAAPNKYYEGLFLGKPIITTKGTIVGEKTEKYNTGFTIDESYSNLRQTINSVTDIQIKEKASKAKELWDTVYSNYVNEFLENTYLNYIKKNI